MRNHRSKLSSPSDKRVNAVLADFIDVAIIFMEVMGPIAALELFDVSGVPRRISERIVAQSFRRQDHLDN